jgi:multiple sugar transport system substrate-binding protein
MADGSESTGFIDVTEVLRRQLSRRQLIGTAGVLGASFAFGGILEACTPSGSSSSGGGTLRILETADEPFGTAMKSLMAPAYKKAAGVDLNVELVGYGNLEQKVVTSLSSGASTYDIVCIDQAWIGSLIDFHGKSTLVSSIADMKAKDSSLPDMKFSTVLPGALKLAADINGKQYGIPRYLSTMVIAYRKDLFTKWNLQPPASWEDYFALLPVLQSHIKADGLSGVYPTCMLQGAQDPGYSEWVGHLLGYGPNASGNQFILDLSGHPIFNANGNGIKAMEDLQKVRPYSPAGTLSYDYPEGTALYQAGNAAMIWTWVDAMGGNEDPKASKVVGQSGYLVTPAMSGGKQVSPVGGLILLINKSSKNQDAAYKFLAWIMSGIGYDLAVQGGEAAMTRTSYFNDSTFIQGHPSYQAFKSVNNTAYLPAWFTTFTEIQRSIWTEVASALAKKKSNDQAMKDAEANVRSIQQKAGYIS